MKKITRITGLLLVTGLVTTGCAAESVHKLTATTAQGSAAIALFQGSSMDYIVANSNKELAGFSELVVQGEVLSFEVGRTWDLLGGDAQPAWKSVVMTLRVNKELKKESGKTIPSTIYVEFPDTVLVTEADFAKAIPVGSQVVAYIETAAPEGGDGITVVSNKGNSKLQSGKNLFRVLDPQALAISLSSNPGNVVFPEMGIEFAGPLSATYPDGSFIAKD